MPGDDERARVQPALRVRPPPARPAAPRSSSRVSRLARRRPRRTSAAGRSPCGDTGGTGGRARRAAASGRPATWRGPVVHALAAAVGQRVLEPGQRDAEHDVVTGLLGDLAGRRREDRLAGVDLALGPRPVVVAGPVHERDLERAQADAPHAARRPPRRRPARAAAGLTVPVPGRRRCRWIRAACRSTQRSVRAEVVPLPVPSGSRCHEDVPSSVDSSMQLDELADLVGVGDADQRLDAPVEVAVHQVRRADVDLRALERGVRGVVELANAKMRECSRKRPRMERTRMFSLRPGTPGRSAQMPRTTMSIGTPGLGRPVQGVDHGLVDHRVDLDLDPRRLARRGRRPPRGRSARSARSAPSAGATSSRWNVDFGA